MTTEGRGSRRDELELWYRLSTGGAFAQRMAPLVKSRAEARNARRLVALNGAHRGETVFVLGSGPQLGTLTPEQRTALASRVTIGVNRTQYVLHPRYFMSAYPSEVLLTRTHAPEATAIHMRPDYEAPVIKGALCVERRDYPDDPVLPLAFEPTAAHIKTYRNVALAVTNLALILGAARIVYIGVEQQSLLHYYDTDPKLRTRIRKDLRALGARDVFTLDHRNASWPRLRDTLKMNPEDMASQEFYSFSHEPNFRAYFEHLRDHGVEPVATTRESVVYQAGARLVDLDEVLR